MSSPNPLRLVELPKRIAGRVYLHSMPGRLESFAEFLKAVQTAEISHALSLTTNEEIELKSPAYAQAIDAGTLPFTRTSYPIPDYGVMTDWHALRIILEDFSRRIVAGNHVLIHCAGGHGRTGMVATLLLVHLLNCSLPEALDRVRAAGSEPDNDEQRAALKSAAERLPYVQR